MASAAATESSAEMQKKMKGEIADAAGDAGEMRTNGKHQVEDASQPEEMEVEQPEPEKSKQEETEDKPEDKPEETEDKPEDKPEEKPSDRPEEKSEEKIEDKPEEKIEEKSEDKAEDKTDEKMEEKAEEKMEEQPVEQVEEEKEKIEKKEEEETKKEEETGGGDAFDSLFQDNKDKKEEPKKEAKEEEKDEDLGAEVAKVVKKLEESDEEKEVKEKKEDENEEKEKMEDEEKKEEEKNDDDGEGKEEGKSRERKESQKQEEEKLFNDIPDTEYFSTKVSQDEMDWYVELGPKPERVAKQSVQCTSCFKQITNLDTNNVIRHPSLAVVICRQCRIFYDSGEWEKDDEGLDKYCRWCAQGGDLLLCDKCTNGFCKRCLQRNLGRKFVANVQSAEEWKCLCCDPKQIYKMRALYHALSKILKPPPKKSSRSTESSNKPRNESEDNFIDENIKAALTTLKVYEKALDEEKRRWARNNREMEPECAANLCKNLRRVYNITKKNMDLLDAALQVSFKNEFPKKTDLISIGTVTINSNLTPDTLKRKASCLDEIASLPKAKRARSSPKKKPAPSSSAKKRPTPASKKKKSRPSPASKKQNGTASAKKNSGKVSVNLFGSKKSKVKSKEVIELESDSDNEKTEEVKKPSIMKYRPGPKSKTRV